MNLSIFLDKFTFMGRYFYTPYKLDLKKMLVYKVAEKYFGSNEVDSIYNSYRCDGSIYTAYTGYTPENDLFCTGIIAPYSELLFNDVTERINQIDINNSKLEKSKKNLIDDINFSDFQYGEMFSTLPYSCHLEKTISIDNIKYTVSKVSADDLKLIIEEEKKSVRIVIPT